MMPRGAKPTGQAVRRNEFLDAAQRLLQAKGYERVTVQDVLDELQVSKGAFYHYFDSKQALLEALVDRTSREAEALLAPLAHDPQLDALDKLQRFFVELARFRTARREFLLAVLRVWYADDNAIVRDKTRAAITARGVPLLTSIIGQGITEGVLETDYPDVVAQVVMALVLELNETLGRLLLSFEPGPEAMRPVTRTVAAYGEALERVLRAPSGSLQLADAETLEAWFASAETAEGEGAR